MPDGPNVFQRLFGPQRRPERRPPNLKAWQIVLLIGAAAAAFYLMAQAWPFGPSPAAEAMYARVWEENRQIPLPPGERAWWTGPSLVKKGYWTEVVTYYGAQPLDSLKAFYDGVLGPRGWTFRVSSALEPGSSAGDHTLRCD